MPPKRKRVDTDAGITPTTTRAMRSSGKTVTNNETSSAKTKKTTTKNASSNKAAGIPSSEEDEDAKPNQKKVKTTKSSAKSKGTKARHKTGELGDDVNEDEAGPSTEEVPVQKPYSSSLALSLFNTYADPDTTATSEPAIGPEGFEKLCSDAQISLDGPLPLIMAWMLDAKEMGKIGRNEWIKGMGALQISSLHALALAIRDLESLLLRDEPPLNRMSSTPSLTKRGAGKLKEKEKEPYNRDRYWDYAEDKKAAFLKLYGFCFTLAKPPETRNIDMETATAFWSVLLMPRYPIIRDIIEFINEKGTYKGANKDLWSMMLEFCQSVDHNLENYEADGAWPTLLDDFVLWKKDQESIKQDGAQADGAQ